MSIVPLLLRFATLSALASVIASVVLGSGAFAQSSFAPIRAPRSHTSVSQVADPQSAQSLEPADSQTSALNWAGYTATDGIYTSVSGSWIVPTVRANTSGDVADATWVGIGGVTSTDLIQAGTEAIPDANGDLVYRAWMETLPQDSQIVPISIAPGDAISVSITQQSPGIWEIFFDDATTGQTYATSVAYNSSRSSADWIEEMPVEVGGVVGLDNFGTVDFTTGYAIQNGHPVTIASSGATPLTMTNSDGMVVAEPSALDGAGSSFSVARTDAASTPLALTSDGVSAVAVDTSPYAFAQGATGSGDYTIHIRRGGNAYRISIQL